MMLLRLALTLMLACSVLFPNLARAEEKPTPQSIQDLVQKAAQLVRDAPEDVARKAFSSDPVFRYGEVYINVIDENGIWHIYPPNHRNEGKSVYNVRDADGKLLVQDIIAMANSAARQGWVKYRWLNPASNQVEPKETFVLAVPEKHLIVYCGLYRPNESK